MGDTKLQSILQVNIGLPQKLHTAVTYCNFNQLDKIRNEFN